MTKCQLDDERKIILRDRLVEISNKTRDVLDSLNHKDSCMLCEIKTIKNLALALNELASLYHFQSSSLMNIKGMDEISIAISQLSEKGYGALIAIEQNDNLDSFITACNITGTYIGAKVSALLLESIFYPGNPLHDGAVIIKNGQIASAGCVLPLDDNKYTSDGRKIGTRHRAALGLSNYSDAIILVVSEETRKVSIAQNGVLQAIGTSLCKHGQLLASQKPQKDISDFHYVNHTPPA